MSTLTSFRENFSTHHQVSNMEYRENVHLVSFQDWKPVYCFLLGDADAQEYAQLKILNKAQSRQIGDLEQKLEDSRRKTRYLEHQFAIVKGK